MDYHLIQGHQSVFKIDEKLTSHKVIYLKYLIFKLCFHKFSNLEMLRATS